MLRKTIFASLLALLPLTGQAMAGEYVYTIDHGTPGVIASESKMARLVLVGSGNCAAIPYEVIADGVKSLSGSLNLSKTLSLPLDFTTVTLSCTREGVKAAINQKSKSLF
ncbi:hypothetical protein MMIC_P0407 [Mariprofundus micogutta]|uniref:Uncharacterized protein n=1 Tax=Mariprofundus micogutta TaxID=1921010 RepID=A0A1L8CKN7_9PROT|nr:hypothetical protein [Mariprofundus micogutta]GAV19473.1 hypothetical protein MMIC_P0407 [Mariprofundus micogutta]